MFDILKGSSEPEEMNEKTKWKRANDDLVSILILSTSGTAATVVVEQHHAEEGEGLGSGQKSWKALATKYNAYPRETRRACYEQLTNFRMEQGQDPEDFFFKIEDL